MVLVVDPDVHTWRHIDPDILSWPFLRGICTQCQRPGKVFGDGQRWRVYCKTCERRRRALRADANRAYQLTYYYAHREELRLRCYKLDALFVKWAGTGSYSVNQVALLAKCGTRTVYRWLQNGQLEGRKHGKEWRIEL